MSSILHIITGLSGGGAERTLFNVVRGTKDRYETRVISLTDEGIYGPSLTSMGIQVECLRLGGFRLNLETLRRALRGGQPAIVQGWMYHGNLAACMIGTAFRGRSAVMWNVRHSLYDLRHEKRLTQYVIRLNSRLSSRADAIIYNSSVARRQHEDFGFASGKSLVIPNGFDLSRWGAFVSEPEISRWTLGVPNDAVVVGHVARFHPMKDHDLFVRIMVRLMRRHPRLCVILAGKGIVQDNGTLMQLIPEEFRHRFFLLGERSDVPALMRMMDVFCLSSRWGEAFPNVLGEAMASGLPAVVTNVGDCAEILGESGFVVPPGDEGALHDALEKMLRLTAGERERLGNMARGRVERDYNLATVIDRYAELYGAYAQETGRAS